MLNVMQIPNLLSRTKKAYSNCDSPELVVTANPLIPARKYPMIRVYLKPKLFWMTPLRMIATTSDEVEAYRFM